MSINQLSGGPATIFSVVVEVPLGGTKAVVVSVLFLLGLGDLGDFALWVNHGSISFWENLYTVTNDAL